MIKQFEPLDTAMTWSHSLTTKFISLSVVLVFTLGCILAYLNYKNEESTVLDNLNLQISMFDNFVATIAPKALAAADVDGLNEVVKGIGNSQDVVYAAIFSPRGTAVSTYLARRSVPLMNILDSGNELDFQRVDELLSTNPDVIIQRMPVMSDKKRVGTFVVAISQARLLGLAQSRFISNLFISLLSGCMLGFLTYLALRKNTLRPILQLEQGTQRIATGVLDNEVRVKSRDEFGRLAAMFNNMMAQLNLTQGHDSKEIRRLEERNAVLTRKLEQQSQELESVSQKLEKLSLHDSLTNLPNRFCVQDNLNRGIADAKLTGASFTVIVMDLDRFKEINDTLGHDCGDQLLVEVGRRLQGVLRPTDLIGRLGGDEFAILLPDTEEGGAGVVAQKMLNAMEVPFNLKELAFSISASIGIAAFPRHGNTTSALLKSADVAMYHAKNHKLGYYIYNPISDVNTPDRLSLMTELRDAIQNDGLQLFYQPKVDLATRKILGVEALLRWQHRDRGFIPPDEFIPMAEQSGLIRRLTYWVISTALLQLEAWHRANLDISISINLSMHNLQDTDFPVQLAQLLDQTHVDNHYIQFEITESVIMNNPDYVMGVLVTLGKMNVSFSIDDFGTGYSSLSTLKRLRVQDIKIDKSFVMDMATDSDDETIVHSIIDMAHTLGLSVTAEGVENEAIMQRLVELGCDMIQGYHISRPLPPERITQLLRNTQLSLADKKPGETNLAVIKGKNS